MIEAIKAGRGIDKILFQRNVSGESIGDIRKLAKEYNLEIEQEKAIVMDEILTKLAVHTATLASTYKTDFGIIYAYN